MNPPVSEFVKSAESQPSTEISPTSLIDDFVSVRSYSFSANILITHPGKTDSV